MPIKPTFPGVYIEEIPSGVHTITGVSTSVALFIGRTARGTLNKPTLCLNFSDFVRAFSANSSFSDMARAVRLFFANGGTQCYAMRIANGATSASVTLKSESGADVITLTAKEAGLIGETIRAAVTYNGLQPEVTFNMEIFRLDTDARGQLVKVDQEVFSNLTMDPLSARFAPALVTQNSKLINANLVGPLPALPPNPGFSQSGRPVAFNDASVDKFRAKWAARLGNRAGVTTNRFRISVDGTPFVDADLSSIDVDAITGAAVSDLKTALATAIKNKIDPVLPLGKTVDVTIEDGPTPPADEGNVSTLLRISSDSGDVFIQPATTNDLAIPLMLGTGQGGLEVSGYESLRPTPTGVTFKALTALYATGGFAGLVQNAFDTIAIAGKAIPLPGLQTVASDAPMYKSANASSANGGNDGVREKWAMIQAAINNAAATDPNFKYKAEVWGLRLAILPTAGGENSIPSISTSSVGVGGGNVDIGNATNFNLNARYYSLGVGGVAGSQVPAPQMASDGSAPKLSDYANAYLVVDKEVDIFNLLILPKDIDHSSTETASLWGPASAFCLQRRAFLLMDAPDEWADVQQATNPATGVNSLRVGLVKDHSAIFYPQLVVNEDGRQVKLGPSGAIAGLMARIDSTRGVWKAAAGIEADIRNITSIDKKFSDAENGVLNPAGINTLRIFPNGVVCWGARTMDGADDFGSEYKYIPVRRVALFIEESLYRGTKFAVFEPNDEPLWAQIRLNVGAFMHSLFRQGAFQGKTPKEAYLVKCDSETTTQNDINQGIVNILVGFAPLKPAEFVIIQIQQLAGQIQV